MKPIYIFATRFRAFWVLLPISIVLTLALRLNNTSSNLFKLYPLIIFCIGAIIFTFVFLYRFIAISYSEIKYIGRFTTRDSATINEGKTLVIDILEKKRVSIQLYGNEGYDPSIKWLTSEDGSVKNICLFRGKVFGKENIAVRILLHFGIDSDEDINEILSIDGFTKSYENVTVSSLTENEHRQIRIKFDKTV